VIDGGGHDVDHVHMRLMVGFVGRETAGFCARVLCG